jgi:hypothetical protein
MKKLVAMILMVPLSACGTPNTPASEAGAASVGIAASNSHRAKPVVANQYVYAGCGVFPAGDIFNHDVTGYTNDPNTSKQFSHAPTGSFAYFNDQSNETVTAQASSAFTAHSVQTQPGGHVPPLENSATMPFNTAAAYNIEGGDNGGYPNNQYPKTDGHAVVLETDTCAEYETFGTSANILTNTMAAYSGRENALGATWASQLVNDANAVTAAGIPLLPSTYWGEDASAPGIINHIGSFFVALDMNNHTNCVSQNGFAFPATAAGDLPDDSNCTWPMHFGDLYRLKSSFDCSPYVASVANLCKSMKQYPIVLDDFFGYNASTAGTVCCGIRFGLPANGGAPAWPYSGTGGLQSFLANLSLSSTIFVHVEPPGYAVQCQGEPSCNARKGHQPDSRALRHPL